MQHTGATPSGTRERIGPRPFVRLAVPELDGLPRTPRRLPARLRGRSVLRVPPA